MNARLDVIGIGNAMVDAIIPSTREDVLKNGVNRDSMNLIDEQVKNNLHDKYLVKGGILLIWLNKIFRNI